MDDLMDPAADRTPFTVQIERVIAVLPQKTRLDGVEAQIAPYVIEQSRAVHIECVRQRRCDLRLADLPMARI